MMLPPLVVIAFAVGLVRLQADDDLPELPIGGAVTSFVGLDAPAFSTPALAEYPFTLHPLHARSFLLLAEADETLSLEADSFELEPYLVIEDLADPRALVESEEAHVELVGKEAHEYRVTVVSTDGEEGEVVVRVRRGGAWWTGPHEPIEHARAGLTHCTAKFGGESLKTARAALRLGERLLANHQVPEVQPLIETAIRIRETTLPADHPAIADALADLAGFYIETERLDQAEPAMQRVLQIRNRALGEDSEETSDAYLALAILRHRQGRYQEARGLYQHAVEISERALPPDHPILAVQLRSLSGIQMDLAQYDQARPCLDRALRIMRQRFGENDIEVGSTLTTLGRLLVEQRQWRDARSTVERAIQILERLRPESDESLAIAHTNLALVLTQQHEYEAALFHDGEALRIDDHLFGEVNRSSARILDNRAGVYLESGHAESARADLDRALEIRKQTLGLEHPESLVTINNLAAVLHVLGEYQKATELHEQLLRLTERLLGPDHPQTAVALSNFAYVIEGEQPERARELETRSVRVWRTLLNRQLPVLTESERLNWAAAQRCSLDHLLSMSLRSPSAKSAAAAYGEVLAWKNQVSHSLFQERAWLQQRTDDAVLVDLKELAETVSRISRCVFADQGLRPQHDEDELQRLIAKRSELERKLSGLGDSGSAEPAPNPESLEAALGATDALIDYFIYRDNRTSATQRAEDYHVVAFVLRHEGPIECIDLGPARSIEHALEAHRRVTSRLVVADAEVPAASLSQYSGPLTDLVWRPLAPYLTDVQRVFVSPDGLLAALPFETLRLGDAEHFLIERYQFVYLQSALDLIVPRRESSSADLLLMGGVDYDDGSKTSLDSPDGSAERPSTRPFARLPATLEEVRRLAELFEKTHADGHASAVLLTGKDATEGELKRKCENKRYLHLATHGYLASGALRSSFDKALARQLGTRVKDFSGRPDELEIDLPGLLSGVVMAGANQSRSGPDDGVLTAEEVAWLNLSACELVTLSACDTGLGVTEAGEGLIGLRRAFHLAGARTTVTSLWRVADDATLELMTEFYRRLWSAREGKGEALRAAQLDLLQKNRQRFHDQALPGTWGAFILEGDWR